MSCCMTANCAAAASLGKQVRAKDGVVEAVLLIEDVFG